MTLTVGSLFAGIGGIELGLDWTGRFDTVWQVEKDEYCRKVLARHWPNAMRYDDVCTVGAHNLAPVDVICGGFPCQDISSAGKRAGIEGERSGLWREYARIVRELRPRYVLVENVAALLGRGLSVVLGDLAACGYDAEWSVLSAQNMGAPHLRERLFVIAHANSATNGQQHEHAGGRNDRPRTLSNVAHAHRERESQQERDECQERRRTRDGLPSRVLAHTNSTGLEGRDGAIMRERSGEWTARTSSPSQVPDPTSTRLERPFREIPEGHRERSAEPCSELPHATGDLRRAFGDDGCAAPVWCRTGGRRSEWWSVEPDVGRVAHGVPARVDRLRALGNAVVPQCAEFVGRLILDMEAERMEAA